MAGKHVLYKARMIHQMRQSLAVRGFVEIASPVVRRHPGDRDRPRVQVEGERWLRESAALALRCNLQYADQIFDIGPMFRPDKTDATHLAEFTMLDLYARDWTLQEALFLAKHLVQLFYSGPMEELSFSDVVQTQFGVDLKHDETAVEQLDMILAERYNLASATPLQKIDRFIKNEIEPLSLNRCLIVSEFPITPEVRAKKRHGSAAIVERFEFQINGTEVVHGYTDEDDVDLFESQAKSLDSLGPEDEIICDLQRRGLVPPSSGFGIGIERLCQVSLREDTLINFVTSPMFV